MQVYVNYLLREPFIFLLKLHSTSNAVLLL